MDVDVIILVVVVIVVLAVSFIIQKRIDETEKKRLQDLAEKGNAKAQFDIGTIYIARNELTEARQWLEKALKQGYSAAKSKLRLCDLKEQGLNAYSGESNLWEIKRWANDGIRDGQYLLGKAYKYGYVFRDQSYYVIEDMEYPDITKAAYWFKKAAEQGDETAQYELGMCYFFGEGVEKDEKLGVTLLLKAAENGESAARLFIEQVSGMNYEEFVMKHT